MFALLFALLNQAMAANVCEVTLDESKQFFLLKGQVEASNNPQLLTSWDMSGVRFQESDLKYLCHATELESLDIYSDSKPQDERLLGYGLQYLSPLKKLEKLDLDGNSITAENLKYLKSESVKLLKLYDNPLAKGEMGLAGLNYLLQLPNLETLILQGSKNYQFTGDQLAEAVDLPKHPKLKNLNLSSNQLGANLEILGQLTNLYSLSIAGNRITPETSFEPLLQLKKLKYLYVGNENVLEANKNILSPQQIQLLRNLDLEYLEINNLGLDHNYIAALSDLKVKNLSAVNNKLRPEDYILLAQSAKNIECIHITSYYAEHFSDFETQIKEKGLSHRFAIMSFFGPAKCEK